MSVGGQNKFGFGPHSPGMLKIIEQVHRDVDEHRMRNGQKKWDWTGLRQLLDLRRKRFQIPTWLAKKTILNFKKSSKQKPKENTMKLVSLITLVLAFSIAANASIGKVASYPVRHPKKSGHGVKVASKHVGHYAKKFLY